MNNIRVLRTMLPRAHGIFELCDQPGDLGCWPSFESITRRAMVVDMVLNGDGVAGETDSLMPRSL